MIKYLKRLKKNFMPLIRQMFFELVFPFQGAFWSEKAMNILSTSIKLFSSLSLFSMEKFRVVVWRMRHMGILEIKLRLIFKTKHAAMADRGTQRPCFDLSYYFQNWQTLPQSHWMRPSQFHFEQSISIFKISLHDPPLMRLSCRNNVFFLTYDHRHPKKLI